MLPAWRCLWCKPRPAPASVPRRGETDSVAVTVSDGAAVAHGSPASECAFAAPAAADLRCQFVAHLDPRLDGGHSCRGAAPRDRRPPRLVGRARPCPRAMRQPSRGAPAHRGRRRAAQRPSWRRPAGRGARQRRPPSAPRGGARRRSPPAAPAPAARGAPISGAGAGSDPQPESRRAARFAVKSGLGMAAETQHSEGLAARAPV